MKIHNLQTGQVVLKQAFLHPRPGRRGRVDLFRPGPWADPLPIHAWLIEHGEHRILVDAGETAGVKDPPFARHLVTVEDELPHALGALDLTPEDITTAIVTHLHPDHFDGTVHLTCPILVAQAEWAGAHSLRGRLLQRLTGAPLPRAVDFRPIDLADGPFGAFAESGRLTPDGRVIAVSTPGHTVGHLSVIAIDEDGRHVLLAGDATDSLEQLRARRPDAVAPKPKVQQRSIDRILAHGRRHPTVYLPTHDSESVARLTTSVTL